MKNMYLHCLRKLRGLIIHIGDMDPHSCCPSPGLLPLIYSHDDELVEVVGALIVQPCCWKNSAMRSNAEVLAQSVIQQLGILL